MNRKPSFFAGIVLLAISLHLFSDNESSGAETISVADYIPLQSGYTWTYLENGINSVTLSVLPGVEYVKGAATKVMEQSGGEDSGSRVYYSMTKDGFMEHKEFSPAVFIPGVGFQAITVTMSPPLKYANAMATLGEIVTGAGNVSYSFSTLGTFPLEYTSTSRIVAFENVVVPFGTFLAVKCQIALTIFGYIGPEYISIPGTMEIWLVKYIGLVKSVSTVDGVQEAYELTGINFSPYLAVDFNVNQTSGVAPFTVSFVDNSAGNITSWEWDFGDGTSSSAQNPIHTYTSAGIYSVSLAATGPAASSSKTKTDYITVRHPPPIADFIADPVKGIAPFMSLFTDRSTGAISSWEWDFGDGSSSTLPNPSHFFGKPGFYTVSLTVSGAGGKATKTKTDYVRSALPGADINKDNEIDMADLILALRMVTSEQQTPARQRPADINGDGRTGMGEAVYILRFLSESIQ